MQVKTINAKDFRTVCYWELNERDLMLLIALETGFTTQADIGRAFEWNQSNISDTKSKLARKGLLTRDLLRLSKKGKFYLYSLLVFFNGRLQEEEYKNKLSKLEE